MSTVNVRSTPLIARHGGAGSHRSSTNGGVEATLPYARRSVAPGQEERTEVNEGSAVTERIRGVIRKHGRLPVDVSTLDDETDLFQAGMTSHASVNVMLGLETEFDIEFPDAMLKRSVFESVAAIAAALGELRAAAA